MGCWKLSRKNSWSKLEDEITESIKSYIEQMSAYSDDSFFQIGKAGKF